MLLSVMTAWVHAARRLVSRKTTSAPKWSNVLWLGVVFKQNAQRFQKMDKLSSTALKNKPLFKEWLVRIKRENLLKLANIKSV